MTYKYTRKEIANKIEYGDYDLIPGRHIVNLYKDLLAKKPSAVKGKKCDVCGTDQDVDSYWMCFNCAYESQHPQGITPPQPKKEKCECPQCQMEEFGGACGSKPHFPPQPKKEAVKGEKEEIVYALVTCPWCPTNLLDPIQLSDHVAREHYTPPKSKKEKCECDKLKELKKVPLGWETQDPSKPRIECYWDKGGWVKTDSFKTVEFRTRLCGDLLAEIITLLNK